MVRYSLIGHNKKYHQELFDIFNVVQNTMLRYPKDLIVSSLRDFFNRDSKYVIKAYIVDDEFYNKKSFLNKPVFKISEILSQFPPNNYHVFVAVGYQGINEFRISKYKYFKKLGYTFASYRSPNVKGDFQIGENSIIMDDVTIQPCVTIGKNVFVWGGAMIGRFIGAYLTKIMAPGKVLSIFAFLKTN